MKIYISAKYNDEFPIIDALYQSQISNLNILKLDYFNTEEQIAPNIIETIKDADVVIADITSENSNVYYEIGIAQAFGKPLIIVSQLNNFRMASLISLRFYNYSTSPTGIKNLAFRLNEILTNPNELKQLKPNIGKKNKLDFTSSTNNNRLDAILNLKGVSKFYELEKWIFYLLSEVPGFDVQYNEKRNGKEYDFILWNSNENEELRSLGNPIPIEVKASNYIENTLIHSLISKANLQGFKSFILITTASLTEGNKKLIRNLKAHSEISILVVDRNELERIQNSSDLLKALIISYRKSFIY
ncbi:restriction endonuclease [Epilithonimonas sp.]|uniref:restriction endonuclease n=1 Tax=Epilithonimonas sp. TaxID=2894511 RepID=UPI002FDC9C89